MLSKRYQALLALVRWDKPIGTLLLLWPTLAAVWLAGAGRPQAKLLVIFALGVVVMRAAGCIANDFADRHWDGAVARTKRRPLVTGQVSLLQAGLLFTGLLLIALLLVLLLNHLTLLMAVVGVVLAVGYPFLKRITNLPQLGLGVAFNWGILMAFTAELGHITPSALLLFFACLLLTVAYDTMYAMVDRDDDLQVGIKSTAILFGQFDRLIIAGLQLLALLLLVWLGWVSQLTIWYFVGLLAMLGLFGYQHWLLREREPANCFRAFVNNHWALLCLFIATVLGFCR